MNPHHHLELLNEAHIQFHQAIVSVRMAALCIVIIHYLFPIVSFHSRERFCTSTIWADVKGDGEMEFQSDRHLSFPTSVRGAGRRAWAKKISLRR